MSSKPTTAPLQNSIAKECACQFVVAVRSVLCCMHCRVIALIARHHVDHCWLSAIAVKQAKVSLVLLVLA